MTEFSEEFIYVVKDIIIERIPTNGYNINSINTMEPLSKSQHILLNTVPVYTMWRRDYNRNKNVRTSFAFCKKFEDILGIPIKTLLDDCDRYKEENRVLVRKLEECNANALKERNELNNSIESLLMELK